MEVGRVIIAFFYEFMELWQLLKLLIKSVPDFGQDRRQRGGGLHQHGEGDLRQDTGGSLRHQQRGAFGRFLSFFLVGKRYVICCDFDFQANGIKIGPQHSPANPNMPAGSQGGGSSGGCC